MGVSPPIPDYLSTERRTRFFFAINSKINWKCLALVHLIRCNLLVNLATIFDINRFRVQMLIQILSILATQSFSNTDRSLPTGKIAPPSVWAIFSCKNMFICLSSLKIHFSSRPFFLSFLICRSIAAIFSVWCCFKAFIKAQHVD